MVHIRIIERKYIAIDHKYDGMMFCILTIKSNGVIDKIEGLPPSGFDASRIIIDGVDLV